MKKCIITAALLAISIPVNAGTWCTFSNFNVAVSGGFVSVQGSSLNSGDGYVFLGDLSTDKGKAIQSLLLTAAVSGKSVRYGHNGQSYICGELPAYSTQTVDPEYLVIITKQ